MWSRANRSRAVAVSTHGRWRYVVFFFFSSRRRHTRCSRDWSSDVCSSDLERLCALGLTVVEVPTGRLGARPLLATVRLIRRLGIEVVHTHGKGAGLHGRLAARWTGAAAVHTFHGIHYESYPRPLQRLYLGLERRLARWTHTAIHVSEAADQADGCEQRAGAEAARRDFDDGEAQGAQALEEGAVAGPGHGDLELAPRKTAREVVHLTRPAAGRGRGGELEDTDQASACETDAAPSPWPGRRYSSRGGAKMSRTTQRRSSVRPPWGTCGGVCQKSPAFT